MSVAKTESGYEPLLPVPGQPFRPRTRILLLAPGDDGAPLSVKLCIEEIQNCASYEALSYVWGRPDEVSETPILRDGQPMRIQANLIVALQSLRLPDRVRRLWADAICINQASVSEKTDQIQLMKLIYQHATRVIVWLGPAIEGVERAFALAGALARRRAALRYDADDNVQISPAAGHNLTPESVRDIVSPTSECWKYLSNIMDLSWWERIWVIQEFLVSATSTARCGHEETPMLNLIASTVYVSYWRSVGGEEEQYEANLWFWNRVYLQKFREPPTSPAHWTRGRELINLLPDIRRFKCKDPKDRLFALLHIIRERPGGTDMWHVLDGYVGNNRSGRVGTTAWRDEALDRAMRDALRPNYEKSTVEVYRDITRYLIRRYHLLNILSQAEYDSQNTVIDYRPFPSWVPNYSRDMAASHMGPVSWFRAGFCVGHRQYLAPGRHHHLHRRTLNMDVLSLDGIFVDSIASTTSVINVRPPETLFLDDYWAQIFGSSALPLRKSATAMVEEFGTALLGGCPNVHPFNVRPNAVDIKPDDTIPWVNKHYELMYCLVHEHLRTAYGLQDTQPRRQVRARISPDHARQFQNHARKWSRGRRLYRTERGKFGLGPHGLRPGDQVIILIGGGTPFILRPTSEGPEGWLLIGETYLHDVDVMAGRLAFRVANGFSLRGMKVYDIY